MSQPQPEKIELALSRVMMTPKEQFLKMAELCDAYDIQKNDVYGDFMADANASWIRKFEKQVCERLGTEDGLFVVSGTMSQAMAAKIHEAAAGHRTKDFVCHYTSHLLLHEQNSYPTLLNLNPVVVLPDLSSGQTLEPLSYRALQPLLDQEPAPFMVILECPHRELGGICTSWEDLIQISAHCRRRNIAFHCDGARLWEAEASYCPDGSAHSLHELIALFDSVYVSFYKGLGGVTGSMLLGNKEFIAQARIWSRRFGGNLFCQLPLGVSCLHGFVTYDAATFQQRRARLVQVVGVLTDVLVLPDNMLNGQPAVEFVPRVPQVSLVHVHIAAPVEVAIAARDHVAATTGISCFMNIRSLATHSAAKYRPDFTDAKCYFEMNMGPNNIGISDEAWALGWITFVKFLQKNQAN